MEYRHNEYYVWTGVLFNNDYSLTFFAGTSIPVGSAVAKDLETKIHRPIEPIQYMERGEAVIRRRRKGRYSPPPRSNFWKPDLSAIFIADYFNTVLKTTRPAMRLPRQHYAPPLYAQLALTDAQAHQPD